MPDEVPLLRDFWGTTIVHEADDALPLLQGRRADKCAEYEAQRANREREHEIDELGRIGDAHDSSGRILLTLGEGNVAVDLDADGTEEDAPHGHMSGNAQVVMHQFLVWHCEQREDGRESRDEESKEQPKELEGIRNENEPASENDTLDKHEHFPVEEAGLVFLVQEGERFRKRGRLLLDDRTPGLEEEDRHERNRANRPHHDEEQSPVADGVVLVGVALD
mmetsp:Transcript_25494/g.63088  ORF Transcript_25494/g.63088 Transcript_25494/m.63088 type:complete len:221 (+) Transcript_25494:2536-3198(+)